MMTKPALIHTDQKKKIGGFDYEVKSALAPPSLHQAKRRDMIWALLCHCDSGTPMYLYVTIDDLPKQNIGYMKNLCLPPTRLDVVVETLCIYQKFIEECNDKYAIVHYDLAVVKPAMQIQYEQSPRFDNIFTCFGPFHIELAIFGVIGNILSESGGLHILEDTCVLAGGSVMVSSPANSIIDVSTSSHCLHSHFAYYTLTAFFRCKVPFQMPCCSHEVSYLTVPCQMLYRS